jgi:hypothetical protein
VDGREDRSEHAVSRRWFGHLAAAFVGAVVAGVLVLGVAEAVRPADGAGRAAVPAPAHTPPPTVKTQAVHAGSKLLLAWSTGGLPLETEQVLESMPQVVDATTVSAGLDWLQTTIGPQGTRRDESRGDLATPIESAVIDPVDYAPFVPATEREAVLSLKPGQALMAATETTIRGSGAGSTLVLRERDIDVTGVVSDTSTSGYELLMAAPVPASWQRVDHFVLMHLRHRSDRIAVERKLSAIVEPGQRFRVRAKGETPYLRYGDAVLPQLLIKRTFGEYQARSLGDGTLAIEQDWTARNIVHAKVPILDEVLCHRVMIPQLRDALEEVQRRGLGFLINPSQFGGCFGPRFIDRNPAGRLSHHSWGIGIDINVAENAFGTRPDQDRRLVEIMEDHGFTWGGRWLVPDGMHFEWVRFP